MNYLHFFFFKKIIVAGIWRCLKSTILLKNSRRHVLIQHPPHGDDSIS